MEDFLMIVELAAIVGLVWVAWAWVADPSAHPQASGAQPEDAQNSRGEASCGTPEAAHPHHDDDSLRFCGNANCARPLLSPEDAKAFLAPDPASARVRRVTLCPQCAERVVSRAHLKTQLDGIRLGGERCCA